MSAHRIFTALLLMAATVCTVGCSSAKPNVALEFTLDKLEREAAADITTCEKHLLEGERYAKEGFVFDAYEFHHAAMHKLVTAQRNATIARSYCAGNSKFEVDFRNGRLKTLDARIEAAFDRCNTLEKELAPKYSEKLRALINGTPDR